MTNYSSNLAQSAPELLFDINKPLVDQLGAAAEWSSLFLHFEVIAIIFFISGFFSAIFHPKRVQATLLRNLGIGFLLISAIAPVPLSVGLAFLAVWAAIYGGGYIAPVVFTVGEEVAEKVSDAIEKAKSMLLNRPGAAASATEQSSRQS